jgi:iron complex outermembrane receptor protein
LRRTPNGLTLVGLAALGLACLAGTARAAVTDGVSDPADLSRLSLEELTDLEITSVSKRPEAVGEAAAAVYVISGKDIDRSAATNLPEALRLAPNLQVQQVDATNYAITARGFNSMETANKLLVMIDGRTIYTPLFSGVLWDTHDFPLGEVDRIEVISGPGGALYGANAVNGVINIVSRSAFDSQGLRLDALAGPEDGQATLRYGGLIGETGAFRAYVSGFTRRESFLPSGAEAGDGADGGQAGFRADWRLGADALTVQGDLYDRTVDGPAIRTALTGGNLLGRWTHSFGETNRLEVQAFFDRTDRDQNVGTQARTDTWDITVQQAVTPLAGHDIVWGAGYRHIDDELISPPGAPFLNPETMDLYAANLFVQDQWRLTHDLVLTAGLKLETGTFRDLEPLPSLRLGWTVNDRAFLWGAVSRAVRIPSRIDRGLTLPGFLDGGRGFEREELWAYELGYRGRPTATTTLSVSLFYNDYDDLRTVDLNPATFLPVRFANSARGTTWGAEVWGTWDVNPAWRLSAGLFTMATDFEHKSGSLDITSIASQGDDPDFQATLRSQSDLTEAVALDVSLRAVDDLRLGTPSYVEADARLGWRLNDQVEVSLAGQNLLDEKHYESDDAGVRRQIGRTVYVGLRWRY